MTDIHPDPRLIVALDFDSVEKANHLIQQLGSLISFYKIGLELVQDENVFRLRDSLLQADKQVFWDMKFLDTPRTVKFAVANAARSGVHMLTVHGQDLPTLQAAAEGRAQISGTHLKLVANTVLTSVRPEDLRPGGTHEDMEHLTLKRLDFAVLTGMDGVVGSAHEGRKIRGISNQLLLVSPGIRLDGQAPDGQARTTTPSAALRAGADYLVVGSPIARVPDPVAGAKAIIADMARANAETGRVA